MTSQNHTSINGKDTSVYLALAVAVFLMIITIFLLSKKFKKSIRLVLLAGLSDSGKTTAFTKIVFNRPKKTVTSLKENEATLNDRNLKLVDLPGAERLRSRFWDQYKTKAQHVVFFVDSVTVDTKLRDLSEYLYHLLSDPILYKNKIRFTITCNKQDVEGAKRKDGVKSILEKELNAIKKTKKGQLKKTSNEEEEEDYFANLGEEAISLDSLNVDFIETSARNLEQLIKVTM